MWQIEIQRTEIAESRRTSYEGIRCCFNGVASY
jgi:hypothetical protein